MDVNKLFKINTRVEVAILYGDNKEDEGLGQSLIQDVYDNTFLIMVPTLNGHAVYLTDGDEVMVWLKINNARYAFESVVLNKKEQDNIKYLELQKPQKLVSSNRRNFVRIETPLSVYYQIISDDEINDWEKIEPFRAASLIDLSGQGLSLSINQLLPRDAIMVLSIRLENLNVVVRALGKVVRIEKNAGTYKVGLEFKNIAEREQDQVVKYVFYTLRKQIQTMKDDY
jgi:c-di-GMP-binding flagellar brake protein YcgR